MVSNKDYKAIAKIIKDNRNELGFTNTCQLIRALMDYFKSNPRFNDSRFLEACGGWML